VGRAHVGLLFPAEIIKQQIAATFSISAKFDFAIIEFALDSRLKLADFIIEDIRGTFETECCKKLHALKVFDRKIKKHHSDTQIKATISDSSEDQRSKLTLSTAKKHSFARV
jgi:hypothetical protein